MFEARLRGGGKSPLSVQAKGLTLLEMLVVVAIMAAIAFVASGTFLGVSEHADDSLVRSEMQEIAKAIRQFRQDTGYYPRQGPFDLVPSGSVLPADLPAHADPDRSRWFNSPANLYQLLSPVSPLPAGHLLETWNADTGRGWRGPYLKGFAEGHVDIGYDINPSGNGAGGSPLMEPGIPDVDGIADPFEARAVHVGAGTLLDWSATPRPGRNEREAWGRPYLFFLDPGMPSALTGCPDKKPCLVSMGPDGDYTQGTFRSDDDHDIVLSIE